MWLLLLALVLGMSEIWITSMTVSDWMSDWMSHSLVHWVIVWLTEDFVWIWLVELVWLVAVQALFAQSFSAQVHNTYLLWLLESFLSSFHCFRLWHCRCRWVKLEMRSRKSDLFKRSSVLSLLQNPIWSMWRHTRLAQLAFDRRLLRG